MTDNPKNSITPSRRLGRMARLRSGAEEEYDRLHAQIWPEVVCALRHAGIRNYSIFRHGRVLFSYLEVPAELEMQSVTRMLVSNPTCLKWEKLVQELQEAPPRGADGVSWWVPMKEIFWQP